MPGHLDFALIITKITYPFYFFPLLTGLSTFLTSKYYQRTFLAFFVMKKLPVSYLAKSIRNSFFLCFSYFLKYKAAVNRSVNELI